MTDGVGSSTLQDRIAVTLQRPVPAGFEAMAETLMQRPGARAVLLYGAALRRPEEALRPGAGPVDFYLLADPSGV
ncbi:MAG: hypothetical protein AAGE83_11990, partial [Pseudomonadota bacterium]